MRVKRSVRWLAGRIRRRSRLERALVEDCPRCGGLHSVAFKPLARPVDPEGIRFTHWASCPVTGEPVLGRLAAWRMAFTATITCDPGGGAR